MKLHRLTKAMAVGLACYAAAPAHAGDTESATATFEVYEQIQFAILLEMDFGTVVSNPVGGIVHLDTSDSSRDCGGGSLTCTGTFNFARLQLSGSDANVRVTYDPSLQLNGPGSPILVEPEFIGGQGAVVQLTGGSAAFEFGAKLHVNPGQAPGTYSGIFTVDVSYE
jgi:Domain of unknown function (DUF4402)